MCEGAFANLTGEFEWSAAGVLTELRAIVVTLEANFNMMALDKHFGLVERAVASKLAPLEAQAKALSAEHEVKLGKLKVLKEAVEAKAVRDKAREEEAKKSRPRRLSVSSSSSADSSTTTNLKATPRESTWKKASAPLRIELTTLGTTLAFVVGMWVANLAHSGKRRGSATSSSNPMSQQRYGQAVRASAPVEATGLTSDMAAQYGAFE